MKPSSVIVVKLRDDKKFSSSLPPNYKADNMNLVKRMLTSVLGRSGEPFSRQEVSEAAKNLGDINESKELYALVVSRFQARAASVLNDVSRRANGDAALSLEAFVREWNDYRQDASHVELVLMWLNSRYVPQQCTDRSIFSMAVRVLYEGCKQNHDTLIQKALDGCVEAINRERRGDIVTRSILSDFKAMMLLFELYFSLMEPVVLRSTFDYYSTLATKLVVEDQCTAEEFFSSVQAAQQQEKERWLTVLDSRSRGKFDECLQKALLAEHGIPVLTSGFKALASSSSKRNEVRLASRLLSQKYVGRNETVRMIFRQYVVDAGSEIVQGGRDVEDSLVKSLLVLKDNTEDLVKHSFDDAEPFRIAMREAFESFIRLRQNKVAELLAKHLDSLLRQGQKDVAEQEVEASIDRDMKLFNFIPAKDVFEAFYWKDFARRLVHQRSASAELEKAVISRLKTICGTSVTMKLEGMMKDMISSEELCQQFQDYCEGRGTASNRLQHHEDPIPAPEAASVAEEDAAGQQCIDASSQQIGKEDGGAADDVVMARSQILELFSQPTIESKFMILTRGYWPTYEVPDLNVPLELRLVMQLFTQFYSTKHSGRRLAWLHLNSTCHVKANFPRGKKELQVSLLQGLVLNLLNDRSSSAEEVSSSSSSSSNFITLETISKAINLALDSPPQQQELLCAVLSLSSGAQTILMRAPGSSGKLKPTEPLRYNDNFTHKLGKIRILQMQPKEGAPDESAATNERVFAERHYVVDAAIVRFMKSRKKVSHQELVAEVPLMLKFPVNVTDLKKRIETLIDRDYMQRNVQDNSIYEYRA